MEIQEVLKQLLKPVTTIEGTVDTLKCGDPSTEVKAIGTTFLATYSVIKKAAELGVNLLITHEPTFYNHLDQTDKLSMSTVYQDKKRLIEETGIAIFRFHDYWHHYQPDGILEGLIQELGWESYIENKEPLTKPNGRTPLIMPYTTVEDVVNELKAKLEIPFVRVVGNLDMPCSRVGLLPGYGGTSAWAIPFFEEQNIDLLITGEGPEWEAAEYVRDAVDQGKQKALIVLGHSRSEEAGMNHLAQYLKGLFPEIPVTFIKEEPALKMV